jgi:hypothetical protein
MILIREGNQRLIQESFILIHNMMFIASAVHMPIAW